MPIECEENPITLFLQWYEKAQSSGLKEPTAVTLATSTAEGRPSCRVVLLKEASDEGFVIFTNRESRKGREIQHNPYAALCFYWMPLCRQVRVEGTVELLPDAESDAYYNSRSRGSQIGAWASLQSQPMDNVDALKQRVVDMEDRYEGQVIPRPPHWGGMRIVPTRIEFWQEQPYRLHDRLVYTRETKKSEWVTEVLFP